MRCEFASRARLTGLTLTVVLIAAIQACASAPTAAPNGTPPVASGTPPASAPASTADRTLRFSVVTMDHVAGGSVVTIHARGSRDTTFEFNDRGRGPNQDTHYEVASDGTLARIDIKGVDYFKQPVDEHLRTEGGRRRWNNDSEHGDAPSSDSALYVPLAGPPDIFALSARALLAAPSHELPLLPAGRARIEQRSDEVIAVAGKSMHIVRYEIDGFDFEPNPIWLDDEGELFAIANAWTSVVREGWEPTLPKLVAVQRDAAAARLGALAKKLAHVPPDAGLAIVHARLFDVETKRVVPDATLVIKGDRIVSAGPSATTRVPLGAETIDAHGKTAIPGLWDMHSHVSPLDGVLDVANGVTGARDLGNDMDETLRTKRAWATGAEIGPRLVLAGFIDGRGPFQAPTKVFADTEAEGIAAIDRYASNGYEQIKLYSSLPTSLVVPLAAHAHAKGLRVSGHVPTGMNAEQAVLAGYDEIQHANFLFLNFLATKDDDTRTPLRFTRVAEKGAALDLASPPVKRFIALLASRKTVVDPTLGVFEEMFVARRGVVAPGMAAIADRLPPQVRRGFLTGGLPVPDGMDGTYRASFAQLEKLVKALYDAGVPIVAGTDGMAGFALHRELEIYVHAGIPAPDVIVMATLGAARVMRHDKEWGSLSPGKYADVVLVDGQPDVRIEDVRRAATVIRGGVVYACADLLRALSVQP
jgi:imidazolonepropionase-like amidohydrolase